MSESSPASLNEILSALQDGETKPLEIRRLLKSLPDSPELRQQWQRHQLIGAVLRRESPQQFDDISDRVREGIAQSGTGIAAWRRPLQQLAVAASVVAVTLVSVQFLPGDANPEQSLTPLASQNLYDDEPMVQFPAGLDLPAVAARTVSAGNVQRPVETGPLVLSQTLVAEPNAVNLPTYDRIALRRHFDAVLFQHNSNAAATSSQPVVPMARVPGLESPQP